MTFALALFGLIAMHGLPLTPTAALAATPAGESHHAVASDAVAVDMGHAHHSATAMPLAPVTPVAATSDDAGSTAPHAHSVWHLCLAVLVAVAGLGLAASVGRRITDLMPRARGRLVRVLESRALDPPSLMGLCLLRC